MRHLAGVALLFLAILAAHIPKAEAYDLGCQYVWSGPNSTNDAESCARNFYFENKILLLPPLIPIIFLVFLVTLYPITFCCRCCCGCCGSSNIRPGYGLTGGGSEWDAVPVEVKKALYPRCYVLTIKITGIIVVVLAGISLILIPVGASLLAKNYHFVIDNLDTDVLQWANESINSIKNKTRDDDNPNRSYVEPIKDNTFEVPQAFIENWTTTLHETDDTIAPYVNSIAIVAYVLAAFPLLLLIWIPLLMCCGIRRFIPACCTCCFFCGSFVFASLCTIVVIVGIVFTLLCGEVKLQEQMSPGVFQWYLVPTCVETSDFNRLSDELEKGQRDAALKACDELRKACDGDESLGPKPTFEMPSSSSTPPTEEEIKAQKDKFKKELNDWGQHQFYCPRIAGDDYKSKCQTVRFVNGAFKNATAKEGSPLCDKCRMSECPEKCNDNATESITYPDTSSSSPPSPPKNKTESLTINFTDAKTATRKARKQLADGEKLISALRVTFEKVNCDSLITQFLKPMRKCYDIRAGTMLIAAGFANSAFWLAQGIMILFKGQKVF